MQHAREPLDVEHLGGEREGAGLVEAGIAVPARQSEQRVHLAHARPGERAIEQGACVPGHGLAVLGRLPLEEGTIAPGVGALVGPNRD